MGSAISSSLRVEGFQISDCAFRPLIWRHSKRGTTLWMTEKRLYIYRELLALIVYLHGHVLKSPKPPTILPRIPVTSSRDSSPTHQREFGQSSDHKMIPYTVRSYTIVSMSEIKKNGSSENFPIDCPHWPLWWATTEGAEGMTRTPWPRITNRHDVSSFSMIKDYYYRALICIWILFVGREIIPCIWWPVLPLLRKGIGCQKIQAVSFLPQVLVGKSAIHGNLPLHLQTVRFFSRANLPIEVR